MRKRILVGCLAVLGLFILSGCIAGTNTAVDVPDMDGDLAGFWTGLWHGLISCVTFVISLFTDKVNIYEVHNTGNWYDFGFMLGISMIFGGGASLGSALVSCMVWNTDALPNERVHLSHSVI